MTVPSDTDVLPRSEHSANDAETPPRIVTVPGTDQLAERSTDQPDDGRSRTLWWAAGAVLVALVVIAGAVYYVTSPVQVTLTVDGETRSIDTRADTVGELLAEAEVAVTEADLVESAVDAELAEGDEIVVRYARPITVVVDGTEEVLTTTELSVGDALHALGAPMDGAAVSLPMTELLPRSGTTVAIITPKAVTLDVAGDAAVLTTTGRTVGDVLESEGVALADSDTVSPAADTVVTADLTITVTRIRVEAEVRSEPIPHDTAERDDPELLVGNRRVVTEGVDGTQDVTYAVTYTNGEITGEEITDTTVTSEPVTEVVGVGTKPAPPPPPSPTPAASTSAATADLNWAALAHCESSGNPRAVNPAGYYGLYQFSPATWASVGGSGNPADASPEEQTRRAHILYERSGAGQWPTCGRLLFT